jgi:hypothetical protein
MLPLDGCFALSVGYRNNNPFAVVPVVYCITVSHSSHPLVHTELDIVPADSEHPCILILRMTFVSDENRVLHPVGESVTESDRVEFVFHVFLMVGDLTIVPRHAVSCMRLKCKGFDCTECGSLYQECPSLSIFIPPFATVGLSVHREWQ